MIGKTNEFQVFYEKWAVKDVRYGDDAVHMNTTVSR